MSLLGKNNIKYTLAHDTFSSLHLVLIYSARVSSPLAGSTFGILNKLNVIFINIRRFWLDEYQNDVSVIWRKQSWPKRPQIVVRTCCYAIKTENFNNTPILSRLALWQPLFDVSVAAEDYATFFLILKQILVQIQSIPFAF